MGITSGQPRTLTTDPGHPRTMPNVLITPEKFLDQPEAPYIRLLQDAGFQVRYPDDPQFTRGHGTEEETIRQLQGVDALIAGGEHITPRVLDNVTDLRVIARSGVGFDRVDIAAATQHGIPVAITPTANHEAVAEQTLALIFGVAKSVVTNDRRVRDGAWTQLLTRPIRGQTLGLFGLGRIGRSTAIRGLSLGMRVIATEQFPDAEFLAAHAVELVEFDQLLTESDYLSIHCPLNASTQDLFDASVFDRMRRGSVLINTARGGLVVEDDLLAALQSGQLSAAGLDVFAVEPTPASNPLLQLDNVVLSPHLAGTDERSMEDMGIESAENIIALHSGGWPTGAIVNDELRAGWSWAT